MTVRVVLFGAGGFIGRSIRAVLPADVSAPSRAELDLLDAAALRAFLQRGDVIINATGYAAATDRSPDGLRRFRRDNVEAVRSLADAAAERGATQLVHLSSVAAMGHRFGEGLAEGELAAPRSPYGQSKLDAELILAEPRPLAVTILRPTSVFGEGRGLAALLCRLATLPLVPLPAGGSALIPFTYVGNVVEAVRLAIGQGPALHGTFIVGDERSYALRDIVAELARGLGRGHPRTVPIPTPALRGVGALEGLLRRMIGGRPILDPVRVETLTSSISYSIAAFCGATGYRPPVPMPEAAERIAAWYTSRR